MKTLSWTCPKCKEHGIASSTGSETNAAIAGELCWDQHKLVSPDCDGEIDIEEAKE